MALRAPTAGLSFGSAHTFTASAKRFSFTSEVQVKISTCSGSPSAPCAMDTWAFCTRNLLPLPGTVTLREMSVSTGPPPASARAPFLSSNCAV
jgi:hypothetical protein